VLGEPHHLQQLGPWVLRDVVDVGVLQRPAQPEAWDAFGELFFVPGETA
jgi:hypothetical protein